MEVRLIMDEGKRVFKPKRFAVMLLLIIVGVLLIMSGLFGFTLPNQNNKALAEQKEGLYIFCLSKPESEYEYLGTVKAGMTWAGKPSEMLKATIKQSKKDFPTCQAIIFTTENMDRADAIRFK